MDGHRIMIKGETFTTSEFVERAVKIHGKKYDYSVTEYKGSQAKIKIQCQKHGAFWQIPADHLSGHGCKRCHFDGTKRWSIDQDAFLRTHYHDKGAYWCAEQLSKTDHAVRGRVAVLKLNKAQRFSHPHIPAFMWSSLLGRVKEDGYLLDFDVGFVWDLYVKQSGKCALTGWDIVFSKVAKENTVSIDRIDSNGDYTKDNVQLTHKMVNRCKLNAPESWFYEMCRAVHENRPDLAQDKPVTWEEDIWNDTVRPVKINAIPKWSNA